MSRRLSSRDTVSCCVCVCAWPRRSNVRQTQPERRDGARPRQVLALIAAPAVDEKHAGNERAGRDQGAEDVLALDANVDRFIARRHTSGSTHIW
jgi:hypothetical protein